MREIDEDVETTRLRWENEPMLTVEDEELFPVIDCPSWLKYVVYSIFGGAMLILTVVIIILVV